MEEIFSKPTYLVTRSDDFTRRNFVNYHENSPDDVQACHSLRKKTVAVKFKSRKHNRKIIVDRTNLHNDLIA